MSFPILVREHPSFEKLTELERRLIAATRAGRIKWERRWTGGWKACGCKDDVQYRYTAPSGVVMVELEGVQIYDANGKEQIAFSYPSDDLFKAVRGTHDDLVEGVIAGIMADLEADA